MNWKEWYKQEETQVFLNKLRELQTLEFSKLRGCKTLVDLTRINSSLDIVEHVINLIEEVK